MTSGVIVGIFIAIAVCVVCYFIGRVLQWFADAKRAMGAGPQGKGGARGRR